MYYLGNLGALGRRYLHVGRLGRLHPSGRYIYIIQIIRLWVRRYRYKLRYPYLSKVGSITQYQIKLCIKLLKLNTKPASYIW